MKRTTIQLRRGTASEWGAADPVLAAGEVGVETAFDTSPPKIKVGNGVNTWSELPYVSGDAVDLTDIENAISLLETDVGDLQTDKVDKAGDTMTGDLVMEESNVDLTKIVAPTPGFPFSGSTTTWRIAPPSSEYGPLDIQYGYIGGGTIDPPVTKVSITSTGATTFSGAVTLPNSDPSDNNHAARKAYVDSGDALKVDKAGDTMTGALTLPNSDPTDANHAARKSYVDSGDALKVDKAGDTVTGTLTIEAPNPAGLVVGSTSDATTDTKSILVRSNGLAGVTVTGDLGNAGGEPGGAFVVLGVDGGAVTGRMAMIQNDGEDGSGGLYTGSVANNLLVGTDFGGPVQIGAAGAVRAEVSSDGLKILDTVDGSHFGKIDTENLSASRTYSLPNESGTVALTGGLRDIVYFKTVGTATFTKATYPWLRAVRVKVQGGGGAGAGTDATGAGEAAAGSGGAGGAYAESFIDASTLASSITVTVGGGGAGGTSDGPAGGNSSFGSLVTADGGLGGERAAASNLARTENGAASTPGATGDLVIGGGGGGAALREYANSIGGTGGNSHLGTGGRGTGRTLASSGTNGNNARGYGGGGGGAMAHQNNGARPGGDGADGIVIVELYA